MARWECSAVEVKRQRAARITEAIFHGLCAELESMRGFLAPGAEPAGFQSLRREAANALARIRALIERSEINPGGPLRLSDRAPLHPSADRTLRVGFLPIAANPPHWMHLVGGLKVMAAFALDRVVYIVAGIDERKPDLPPFSQRYAMVRLMVRRFRPLFASSGIAAGFSRDGEANMFRILSMNRRQRIAAFYVAGADHAFRWDPRTGAPDTIARLEDEIGTGSSGYNRDLHSVTAVFLERKGCAGVLPRGRSELRIESIPFTSVRTSSTSIRRALCGELPVSELALLPYSVFRYIRKLGLYGTTRGAPSLGHALDGGHGARVVAPPL
jgi:nicotinic acid mononucleotide adenylyltransferase